MQVSIPSASTSILRIPSSSMSSLSHSMKVRSSIAPFMLEIDVEVGRLLALLGDEALEQQVAGRGIDRGDPEAIADRAVRRAAPALAQDRRVEAPREGDDVVDGQEIAREVELFDQ